MSMFSALTLVLIFGSNSYAAGFDCASSKPFPFIIAGYISGQPDATLKGKALKKDDGTARKLFEISNPEPTQESTYAKVFDIGIYRFVRNLEAAKGWDIYRKDTPESKWVKQSNLPNPLKVFDAQNVYVRITGRNQLTIQRISGDDKQAKSMTVTTNKDTIQVQSGQRKFEYSLKQCMEEKKKIQEKQLSPQRARS